MTHTVWRREAHDEMPWRNGGGTTLEVARAPRGDAAGEFDWRVSFALVDGDGPFSPFPGVDRVITLVDGDRMRLEITDRGRSSSHDLEPFAPFAFAGEAEVSARVGAPTLDLNVMTSRDRCTARVTCHALSDEPLPLDPDGHTLLVACLTGEAHLTGEGADDDDVDMRALDVAALGHCASVGGRGVVAVVSLALRRV